MSDYEKIYKEVIMYRTLLIHRLTKKELTILLNTFDIKCSGNIRKCDMVKRLLCNVDKINFTIQHDLLRSYKDTIRVLIRHLLESKRKTYTHEPTLFGDNSYENVKNLETAYYIRQTQMKEGIIAQIIIGNFIGWEDLKSGHPSGLDCRKLDNSIIVEVKNKFNTCNSNSAKTLCDKLSYYKKNNPSTRCIWGIVNPKNHRTKLHDTIIHNGVEIEKIQGKELFKLVFTINNIDYSDDIIRFVKHIMYSE